MRGINMDRNLIDKKLNEVEEKWRQEEYPHYTEWQKGYIACLHDFRRNTY